MRLQVLALCAALLCPADATLYDALSQLVFLNNGTVKSTDVYEFLPIACGYLEAENVTCTGCSWGVGGACPYLYIHNSSAGVCTPGTVTPGQDRPGGDFMTIVQATDDPTLCEQSCCDNSVCVAWVYVPAAPSNFLSCSQGDHCCYLKSAPPTPTNSTIPGITSGSVTQPPNTGITPPLGMRSSVPLGGLGAGALEVRADGRVHEVTIVNQSPAGAAKFGVLEDMLFATWQGAPAAARAIRTHPPAYATGVAGITYGGMYPVSRLQVQDPALPLTTSLFAYSTLKPGDPIASGFPAVTFTLVLENPTAADVSGAFLVTLPFGAINDCMRGSSNVTNSINTTSAAACDAACAAAPQCASWTWTASSSLCRLASDVPHSTWSAGKFCGVSGTWTSDGVSVTRVQEPAGGAGGPASGSVTLRPVVDASGAKNVQVSVGVAADAATLYAAFAASGTLPSGNGVTSGVFNGVPAGAAGAAVSATVPAGGTATLTVVFSWFFPYRDHMGVTIGNFYSNLYEDSADVARQLATPGKLTSVVADIAALHNVFVGSSLPEWLADAAINEQSHFRGFIWTADGRMREFEANDCPDVDSIHNDAQRHLPYIWNFPEYTVSQLRKWGSGQAPDGHIWEYLGSFGLGPLDVPGGRIMADTTTLWIVWLMEYVKGTGDMALLQELYPIVVGATRWQIGACGNISLPEYLVCTYDIIDFQAAAYLATLMGDNATTAAAQAAYSAGVTAVNTLLWNSTYNYYRAYIGGDAIMADCLYGQMIGLHHDFGFFVDPSRLAQHLSAELTYNGNKYGFSVVTGRHEPPPERLERLTKGAGTSTRRVAQAAKNMAQHARSLGIDTQDDVNWLGAGPTWSYVQLAMGNLTVDAALEPTRLTVENFRTRINDWWNLVGITTSGDWGSDSVNGMPYITSHYGFLLPNFYLIPRLTGQQLDLAAGTLSFQPMYACPFTLPVVFGGGFGTLSCASGPSYTLTVVFGTLALPAGGLSVSGSTYAGPVSLGPGDSVTW